MDNATTFPAKHKRARLEKTYWGYIFIAPFFIVYLLFAAYPIFSTFYYAFTYREVADDRVDPEYSKYKFVGVDNFYFKGERVRYYFDPMKLEIGEDIRTKGGFLSEKKWRDTFTNTFLIWIVGFIPQIGLALLFASWFTDAKVRVRGQGFFKVIFYMPNIMTAATIGYMFYYFAYPNGLLHVIAQGLGVVESNGQLAGPIFSRGMVAFINFWMWFGNTMIVMIAGILGINPSLFEAANIDGANGSQVFWRITVPLIRPILTFNLVQSLIGGMQMYDVPVVIGGFTSSAHGMYISTIMTQIKKMAYAGHGGVLGTGVGWSYSAAAAIFLFLITTILSIIIFQLMKDRSEEKYLRKQKKLMNLQQAGGGY